VKPPPPDPFAKLAATCGLILVLCAALLGSAAAGATAGVPEQGPSFRPNDSHTRGGFDRFYNLDYDKAIGEFEKSLEQHPDDPFAVNHLLTAVMFRELYRMGALNTGEYANDSFVTQGHRPADTQAKQRIRELIGRARNLEEKRIAANDKDVDAYYARGVTRGQQATFTGLVERSWFAALRAALGARHDHEKVLELNPNYTDAKLIIGTHDYVVGSLPWAVKLAASIVGFSGDKRKGIEELFAAANGGEASVDAKVLLVLFLRREGRHDEALKLVRELNARYPQNVLMALEEGNLLRASHQPQEAAAIYRKVWDAGRKGRYPYGHYELSAVSLGDVLRSQKDYQGAADAYSLVEQVSNPDPEVKQQALLGAGEMDDLLQKRDAAVQKYQACIAANGSSGRAETARHRLKEAYRE
jgi:tetratricopeptide (TPR) repeat protein